MCHWSIFVAMLHLIQVCSDRSMRVATIAVQYTCISLRTVLGTIIELTSYWF